MLVKSYLSLQTGHLKPLEKWACEGDELFFVFPKAGVCQVTSFGSMFSLTAGDLLVMSGRSGAKLGSLAESNESELVFSWFSISPDSLFPLFAAEEIGFLQNVVQEFRTPKTFLKTIPLIQQCSQLLGEVGHKIDLNHRSQLLRVAALVLSSELRLWEQKHVGYESSEDHMLRIFEQLSSDQLLNLSVDELSQKFGCSRRHLSRLFHQRFGLSVATLRMEMRLLKASSLLRDPSVKVINVAEQCGFNHLGLFNTCFKRRFGLTPGLWRNTYNEKNQSGKPGRVVDTCPLQVNGLCPWNGKPEAHGAQFTGTTQSVSLKGAKAASAHAAGGMKKAPGKPNRKGANEGKTQPFPPLTHSRPIDGQGVT
jgi:AraC-like DNA-binding protein